MPKTGRLLPLPLQFPRAPECSGRIQLDAIWWQVVCSGNCKKTIEGVLGWIMGEGHRSRFRRSPTLGHGVSNRALS